MKRTFGICLLGLACLPPSGAADELWDGFRDPPAEARPFVRWWWNGNRVTEEELLRELDLLKDAGIGGVEINPIALHEAAPPTSTPALEWLSPEWNEGVAVSVRGARERGMIADLIVGSGWPFGGRFLDPEETIQGLAVSRRRLTGPSVFEAPVRELIVGPATKFDRAGAEPPRLRFLRLAPVDARQAGQAMDVTARVEGGTLRLEVPPGEHVLFAGAWQRGFRRVMHGAPGADGPVLDHYNQAAVEKYLEHMSRTLGPVLGGQLGDGLRAMFCDSIELSGANWTSDLSAEFESRRGYPLDPYLPFVLDREAPERAELADAVLRARYDFSKTLVELFRERFIRPFHRWCRHNGTLSRYQAYGFPWLMGMLDGYLIPDIPEGDTWLYNDWQGLDEIRYAVWNKYAASGAHLAGRRLVGCEAITNTKGVFRATLEYMKQATDLSFITGVNHLVLHGFNYSPPEAGFPGWIRYGAYLSEQNPWWPYFRHWTDYNARLSWVLQDSRPVVEVAILGPSADIWSRHGLERGPFVHTPEYLHLLWQAVHQVGASADYISEAVLQDASFSGGRLRYGPMAYELLIVVEARSLEAETARALRRYVEEGGKLVFVGEAPSRSPGLRGAGEDDRAVQEAVFTALKRPGALHMSPPDPDGLRTWMDDLLGQLQVSRAVELTPHDDRLFQIRHRKGEREIYFFSNMHRDHGLDFEARFPTGERTPWRWDAETGERAPHPTLTARNHLRIALEPLESLLLVFGPEPAGPREPRATVDPSRFAEAKGPWRLTLDPVRGERFTRETTRLADLSRSPDARLRSFGGTIVYTTEFDSDDPSLEILDLGRVHGVSHVRLNGHDLGVRWWGHHRYPVAGRLRKGRNTLEVTVPTVLINYTRSLARRDNPMAWAWSHQREGSEPVGALGPVRFHAVREDTVPPGPAGSSR
jgi:hypothetical protein